MPDHAAGRQVIHQVQYLLTPVWSRNWKHAKWKNDDSTEQLETPRARPQAMSDVITVLGGGRTVHRLPVPRHRGEWPVLSGIVQIDRDHLPSSSLRLDWTFCTSNVGVASKVTS